MTVAQGVSKKVAIKKEAAWGTPAGTNGARYLRRVTSDLSLTKDVFASKEIRDDQQTAVSRHGMRKVEGTLATELSPGSYADILAAATRSAFAAGPTITAITIAATATGFEGADFAAAGFQPGHIVRAVGFVTAANNANNFIVTAATANALTGEFVNGDVIGVEIAGANVTIALAGKQTLVPSTGHTNDSFTVEHFFSDINESEVFTGVKIDSIDLKLPPSGMAEMSVKLMGKDMQTGNVQYFTAPAAASTTNALAAVNGRIYAGGARLTLLTSLDISIKSNLSTEPVVGSNTAPDIFRGRVAVSLNMSAFFENGTLRDMFIAEGEMPVFAVFTESEAPNADFIAFRLPRVKPNGASKDDGEKGLVQSIPAEVLKSASDTTISIQDSTQ